MFFRCYKMFNGTVNVLNQWKEQIFLVIESISNLKESLFKIPSMFVLTVFVS